MGANPGKGYGTSARPILRSEIEAAQRVTASNAQAAVYLNVNYQTYRKYAVLYDLFESHRSSGKGIPRKKRRGAFGLDEILNGQHPNYDRTRLKERMISVGYLSESCYLCGFDKKRQLDDRCPLVLHYEDGNHHNITRDNLTLRCYNCAYLTTGRISMTKVMDLEVKKKGINRGVHDQDLMDTGLVSMDEIEAMQNELMGDA